VLFKITRSETYANSFAVENIVYDLFILAGGLPLEIDGIHSHSYQYIGLDAGHDSTSRWVSVCIDPEKNKMERY
jgi:hypothetical protein